MSKQIIAIENENYFFEVYLIENENKIKLNVVYMLHEVISLCYDNNVSLENLEVIFYKRGEVMSKKHGHFLKNGKYEWNWDE
jgi:hypothetical protein